MGGPTITDLKNIQMAEHKKSLKNLLKKPFVAFFLKKKEKNVEPVEKKVEVKEPPVVDLLESFIKLEIEKKEKKEALKTTEEGELKNFTYKVIVKEEPRGNRTDSNSPEDSRFGDKVIDSEEQKPVDLSESFIKLEVEKKEKKEPLKTAEDELKNFTYKVIMKEEPRGNRTDSNSSEDSGFADKVIDSEEEKIKKTEVEIKKPEKKKKRIQTVVIARGPVSRRVNTANYHPYGHEQISQVNKQTFSGGQVIVNQNTSPIDEVIKGVENNVRRFEQKTHQEKEEDWNIAQEFINNFTMNEFEPNTVHEVSDLNQAFPFDIDLSFMTETVPKTSIYLTPPRSENSLSPKSDLQPALYTSNPEDTMSPDAMYNSDYERYQEITPMEEFPSCVTEFDEKVLDKSRPERSSMTMKQFKDMQKDIANRFSKMECCQEKRKCCKEIFQESFGKLRMEDRKELCLKVAQLDVQHVYGVLKNILLSLSNGADNEELNLSLFTLICEKVFAVKPTFFVDEHGLDVLKTAVFRCPSRPLLTRYLVQCIRAFTRGESYRSSRAHVFHEVDASGDTVVSACARVGDTHAAVLAELVRARPGDPPLFDVHHANADGYTALHLACLEHSDACPHTHTVHVLLQHAGADLWRGDIKGGDTAVHLAVNSVGCSLTLLLLLFRPLPRASWKKLAHAANRSSVTPLEYARSAIKSSSRQNYPVEVLDFLKKCR